MDGKKSVVRTPWLARTGWLERFTGINMSTLYRLTEKPQEDEWLWEIWKDMDVMMETNYMGVKDIHKRLWERILFWLASPNTERISKEPMNIYLNLTPPTIIRSGLEPPTHGRSTLKKSDWFEI